MRIETVARRGTSLNHNPRWKVTFSDGTVGLTAIDAQVGYVLGPHWEGREVEVTRDERGHITHVQEVQVRVMYPTSNPKRVRSEYLCHGCYDIG